MSDDQQQARLNENADDKLTQHVHQQFLAVRKKKTNYVRLVQLAILLLFFFFWEMAARLKWIDVLLFSYPTKVFKLLWDKLLDGSLLPHVGVTVVETIIGFVLGTLFGTALAVVIWWSPFLSRVLDPYIVVLNSMPKVALGPLFIVGLGPGLLSIIATTLSITVIITTLVVYGSFKEVDTNYVKVVTLLGGNQRKVFLKAILPASFPAIVSTLKVNVGLAWIGVIVGEFLVSQMGLGYLIIYGFQVFNFTLVISTLFVIAIVATVMYQIVSNLEKRMTKYR
ncbi:MULTISPECIES: ABC transporter permease [unclassified Paenibacillus]|uniref:ABC transporter permease n=1 Tax=unclassified Paenibacillus TaxID=185978 RepID=UPI0027851BC6|nr:MULTISPECIES: ABC transporter permease [unclassified Paenibacillus]MDQ0898539.1 NitT/TauT family transport system permease protein [Paenibacillus sp. V4I7]MDQ0915469.1 NitT/TauT family transport system permease protein [Paenibacillus sp. V4I5]